MDILSCFVDELSIEFPGSLFCSIDHVSVFVPVPYCLDDHSFVIQLEVRH